MRPNIIRIMISAILIMAGSLSASAQGSSDLLGRINSLRSSLGLAPYSLNGALSAAATNHAQWMATSSQVSHVQPNGSRPRDRAAAAGYTSSWVSENIYMGTNAGVDDAWRFWTNSPVHYAGLTNTNYRDVGIGISQGAGGQAFVLVFGNPGGADAIAVPSRNRSGGGAGAAVQPSYVVGIDPVGNIMHEVQPGDTLGDIALYYGYTWAEIPAMLNLNGMTWDDIRVLKVGSVFLVPPYDGTYTPTPAEETSDPVITAPAEFTPEAIAANPTLPPPATFVRGTPTWTPAPTATPSPTATRAIVVRALPETTQVAMAVIEDTSPPEPDSNTQNPPLWLIAAIGAQVTILGAATLEFIRRSRR